MFEQFKQFVNIISISLADQSNPNTFWPVPEADVLEAERLMGERFPETLRRFYQEIGYGFYTKGVENERTDQVLINRVMDPQFIAELLTDTNSVYRPPEGFPGGGIPFFDLGDYTYLVVKPTAASPDAVFWPSGKRLVSNSLAEFFESLYRDAKFYRIKPSAQK